MHWANSQALEASQPASSCLFTAGKAKSSELLFEPHLWLSLGSCCNGKKKKTALRTACSLWTMCCTGLLCSQLVSQRRGKQKKFFNKMENITVNIMYKSIRRFREEETRNKQSYGKPQTNEDRRLLINRKLSNNKRWWGQWNVDQQQRPLK